MASFSEQLLVAGQRYPVRQCTYEFTQATDPRGRVSARVRTGLVYLTLDVPRMTCCWTGRRHRISHWRGN
jgi:hypothetical protein